MHIKDAENGLSCNCKCLECNEQLEAVQGQIRDWYFRHSKNINCQGGQQTAIHLLAKQIIADNSLIAIPGENLIYKNPQLERKYKSIIPDVTVVSKEQDVFFEIAVTNPVDAIKEKFYTEERCKSVEIDLTQFSYDITPQQLETLVLRDIKNKRIIFWEERVSIFDNKEDQKTVWWKNPLVAITLIVGFGCLLYKVKRGLFRKNRS